MSSGIYYIKNTISNKVYVGQAININKRKSDHFYLLSVNKHRNIYLQRSYNKHGKNVFKHIVLETVDDINKLDEREQYWIDYFVSQDIEVYNIDKVRSSSKGTKRSLKFKEECRVRNTGKIITTDTRNKISTTLTGKPKNKAHIEKVVKANQKSVVQIDKNTDEIIYVWDGIHLASKALNISHQNIVKVCQHQRITAGGYKWQYN